jgi:hypothetical protein
MGRNAAITFGDGLFSAKIVLGTGFTQGNGPSPLQFNFCQQILIFKIEFNPLVKEIDWPRLKLNQIDLIQDRNEGVPVPVAAIQAGRDLDPANGLLAAPQPTQPKGKVEGFADDTTALGKAEEQAIVSIKQDLVQFARIS